MTAVRAGHEGRQVQASEGASGSLVMGLRCSRRAGPAAVGCTADAAGDGVDFIAAVGGADAGGGQPAGLGERIELVGAVSVELAAVREEPADLMVGGLAGGAGVAEGDQQGVFLKLVGLGFQGERVVFAGLFGLFEGVGVEVLRCDVAGLRQGGYGGL